MTGASANDRRLRHRDIAGALALLLPCLAVVAGVLAPFWRERSSLQALVGSAVDSELLPKLDAWRAQPRSPLVLRGALFGDSVVGWGRGRTTLAALLEEELAARGVASDFAPASHPAFSALQFYYLLDTVLAGAPGVVVVQVNPRSFADAWVAQPAWRFATLSRLLSARRALAIRDALAADQVSQIDPWVYRLEERLGALYLMDGVREWGRARVESYGERFHAAFGLRSPPPHERLAREFPPLPRVLDARLARKYYGGAFAATPGAQVLCALLLALRQARVTTLFYVTPVNVDRLAALGLTSELALTEKIAALRNTIEAGSHEWLDLHASAREADFLDASEHLREEASRRVATALADALVRGSARAPRGVAPAAPQPPGRSAFPRIDW